VGCTAASACTAAGWAGVSSQGTAEALAERWNGKTWSIQATPGVPGGGNSQFGGLSCTSAQVCTAVGNYETSNDAVTKTLAERWNGKTWSVQVTPDPEATKVSEFDGVSCPAASGCVAAGYYDGSGGGQVPLAESWNGTSWALQPPVTPSGAKVSQLLGVSCRAATACEAVGSYMPSGRTNAVLAEKWNGKTWAIQNVPVPAKSPDSYLQGVSCPAAGACVAVGHYYPSANGSAIPVAETWNGTTWRVQAVPAPPKAGQSSLYSVSCTSAGACTAVGTYNVKSGSQAQVAFAERWNGKAWAIQKLADVATVTSLSWVSCPTATGCEAVGGYTSNAGAQLPLAESWNGKAWTAQKAPAPAGSGGAQFSGVSCTSAAACTATGTAFGEPGNTLAERWNGKSWQIQTTPNPPNAGASASDPALVSVSCVSARSCYAVGDYSPDTVLASFAETWNGSAWSLQATTAPAGAISTSLSAVTCGTSRCTAVGDYSGSGQVQVTLAIGRPVG
jgi:hypothetical protein